MTRPQSVPASAARAVLYLRQSTAREESISLELQEAAGREYCRQRGYRIVAVESDPGISGRTWNRPAVQRVMSMVDTGQADVIVLWKWSRLSRARLDWAVAVDKVEQAGGRIESATEPVDVTTSTGRLARGVLAEFAAFESERIGDVWRETLTSRVARGVPPTGGDRYGYERDGDNYRPAETASVLAECYRRYVDEEWGWTKLVRWLNASGQTTTTGAAWDPAKLRGVMDSGFAAGLIVTGARKGTRTYHPGLHEAIITPDLWERYQRRRAAAPRPSRSVEPVGPLSGLLRCGDCDGPMKSANRALNGHTVPGYGCTNYLRFRDGRRYVTCYRHRAEQHVFEWVKELASDVEELARAKATLAERRVTAINNAAAIEKRSTTVRSQLGTVTVRWAAGKMTDDAYYAAADRLQADLDTLKERAASVTQDRTAEVEVRELAPKILELWEDATPHELRLLLSKVVRCVTVHPPKERGGRVTFDVVPAWD